jgi:hypothetical protein
VITYQLVGYNTDVFLDGVRIGQIKPVKHGFAYVPRGISRTPGETLPTIEEIKATLEEM